MLQERDGRVDIALALPPEGVRVTLAFTLSAAVEEEELRSRGRARNFARFWVDVRPGNEITAAPFREGMYQPFNRNPSLVVKPRSRTLRPGPRSEPARGPRA